MAAIKPGKVYVIDWFDHWDSEDIGNAWVPISPFPPEPCRLRTVCYLVGKGRDAISVAHTMDGSHSTAPSTIARAAIISMIELELPAPVEPKARKKRAQKPKPNLEVPHEP